ncbi:rhomboid family intramembrane serine protease [Streptococcus sciuri]|uniref:Rhomboid family intramembrane serine protease n=1 Tax=Streptococcus sciuri TaxID=2973939 RepID=A0ABT2F7M6_9STRE|nr:rhomboid family intramembrane serine protease [Streptococcus sciuri]MCS4488506.1 rhomboid family intramembrane serine protease [Streptococcus sciuri]
MSEMKKYPATLLLLILTTFIFLAMQLTYGSYADTSIAGIQFGAMYGDLVKVSPIQLWRLITPIFVHFGWQHFIINMLTVYFLGQIAETIWGTRRFLLLYVLSGVMGNAVTLFFTPNVVAAGASTAIFGLFAAVILIGYYGHNAQLKQLSRSYQALIVINLIFNLFTPGISLAGHLGGLFGGALIAVCLPTLFESHLFSRKYRILAVSLYVLAIVTFVFLGVI